MLKRRQFTKLSKMWADHANVGNGTLAVHGLHSLMM